MRSWKWVVGVAIVLLAVVGLLLIFVRPSDSPELVLNLSVDTPGTALVFLTFQREVGLGLVWIASVVAIGLAGRVAFRPLGPGKTRGLFVSAALVAVLGGLLVFVLPSGDGASFDFGSLAGGQGFFFLTMLRAVGLVLIWVATLTVAAVLAVMPRHESGYAEGGSSGRW